MSKRRDPFDEVDESWVYHVNDEGQKVAMSIKNGDKIERKKHR